MKDEGKRDIFFIIYILAVLVLSVIYFTVPERATFLENQMEWWKELWEIISGSG